MAQLNNIDLTRLNNMSLQQSFVDLYRFRTSFYDGYSDDIKTMKILDSPSNYYFKLLFYFTNPYAEDELSSNLLGLNYNDRATTEQNGWGANTALNYLYNNKEYTRFRYLSEFIKLLSDINIHFPWYFQSITGLDTALERTELGGKEFKIEEERKNITIKCLPDALDNRIGKMLDLYRSAAFSQMLHKEVIPANLRKFDMGIFIYTPLAKNIVAEDGVNIFNGTRKLVFNGQFDDDSEQNMTTYTNSKFIELRNCEIDLNSSKTPFGDVNNVEGTQHEYEISISFDTCYERRYDITFNDIIGDFVIEDLYMNNTLGNARLNDNLYKGTQPIIDMVYVDNDSRDPNNTSDIKSDNSYYNDENEMFAEEMNTHNGTRHTSEYLREQADKHEVPSASNESASTILGNMDKYINKEIRSLQEYGNNAINGIKGSLENRLTGVLSSILMGNIYKFSLTNDVRNTLNSLGTGGLAFDVANKVSNEIKNKVIENQSNFTTDPIKLREGKSMYIDDTPVDPGQPTTDSIGNRNTTTFQQQPIETNINKNLSTFGNRYEQNGWTRKPKGNLKDSNNTGNN